MKSIECCSYISKIAILGKTFRDKYIIFRIFLYSESGVTQLRNNLIFIIDNLQYYLQVDVLESQYTIMENNMKNTRNFEDVQKAHSIFLANVMSQTFLSGGTTERENSVRL